MSIPMIHWEAKTIGLSEGMRAGMEPVAPPHGATPAGYQPKRILEWTVSIDRIGELAQWFDVFVKHEGGKLYGYFNEKGHGFR